MRTKRVVSTADRVSRIAGAAVAFLLVAVCCPPACAEGSSAQERSSNGILQNEGRRQSIKELIERAAKAIDSGDYKAAIRDYERVVELDPKSAPMYFKLGALYMNEDDYREAIGAFEKAVDFGAKDANTYYYLANACIQYGEYEKAQKAYEEAVKLKPDNSMIRHDLGMIYLRRGRLKEAEKEFIQALDLDPRSAKTMLLLGMTYLQIGKPEQALEYVTLLREVRDEVKATKLEALVRGAEKVKPIPEPDTSNLVPDTSEATAPTKKKSRGNPRGKTTVTGTAQINLQGGSTKSRSEGSAPSGA